jgi:hypothetical protein
MYDEYFKGEIILNITMCLLQWTITDWSMWSYSITMLQSKYRIN